MKAFEGEQLGIYAIKRYLQEVTRYGENEMARERLKSTEGIA